MPHSNFLSFTLSNLFYMSHFSNPLILPVQIIYVSEIMCKIFWDNGEFRLAEDYLLDALSLLPQPPGGDGTISSATPAASTQRIDARVFQLQLKLATVYSESSRFERYDMLLFLLTSLPKFGENS